MAFLVFRRDDEATKLRAFPLVLREGAKAWYQTLAPEARRDWETLKTAFIEEFCHQEPPEEIWRQLLELHQTSPNDYRSYEGKFSNLWEKWCASLGEGERAPECLKKDCFLAGLYPILRKKVKVKFPDTFEKAMAYAREKDRKLKFQAQLQGGMEPPPSAQPIARTVVGTSATDQELSQQELLQQITNQLESLSINLVQGVRAPQSGNDRNRQEGQRQAREYVCYNCGEMGHGMYFCPHPRCYQGNGNHRRAPRQQVTPPRARPPNGQQNAPVAPPIQILRPPPPPLQRPAEIPPLPSGAEDRAVSIIRFKKKNNEYVEGVLDESIPQVSHEGTLLTIESGSQATPLANNALDKGKGPTKPPGTSMIPSTSSMPATTPSRAPSTSSLLAVSPSMTPSSMVVPTLSLTHTTSFIAESSLGREFWERRPITRSAGLQNQTVIDVLLVDVCQIDKFSLASINNFFATQKTNLYSKAGVPCREVARLIFADFPTSLLVDGLGSTPLGE
ncbi:hypothetical protein L7F22_063373 [Adiantum nelumboides]|nr:hypothetical protein [Adiantum nelumboides]